MRDPQIAANRMFAELKHPDLGTVRQPTPCAEFSRTAVPVGSLAPAKNQHGAAILHELGYRDGDIATLSEQGVIGPV
jgi:crotonobetainyl-CoA:carnitine CoA-transferase CaiB-like acyl-CoA transferase